MPLKCNSNKSTFTPPLKRGVVLRVPSSWRYLKRLAILCAAGLALMQGGALAEDATANGVGLREVNAAGDVIGRPRKFQVAQADEDGAALPGGEYPQKRFGRRRWQGGQFPGGPDGGTPGQMRDLDTGVAGGLQQPGAPGGFYGRRGPGRFGPGGRPGGFRRPSGAPQAGGKMFGGPLDLTLLGLTEEQKDRIRQNRLQSGSKARGLRRELKLRRDEMKDLMFDPDATEAQIRGKRRVIRQMQDQLEDVVIDDFLSLRAVLTPEQRKRLPEVRPDSRLPVMGQGRASMGGPGGGLPSGRVHPDGPPQPFGELPGGGTPDRPLD